MGTIDTKDTVISFGRHCGERLQRVPVGYLIWASGQGGIPQKEFIEAELERRGSTIPEIDVSGHAIDRASLIGEIRKIWKKTSTTNEGLHTWLCRVALESRTQGVYEKVGNGDAIAYYLDLKFVFAEGIRPALKTVIPKKKLGGK